MILLLTLELKGLALIHVHNYESGSHQSHLQGKPTCSPALRSHWLLLVRILHYDWKTIIGYSKINGLYFPKILKKASYYTRYLPITATSPERPLSSVTKRRPWWSGSTVNVNKYNAKRREEQYKRVFVIRGVILYVE